MTDKEEEGTADREGWMVDLCQCLQPLRRLEPAFMSFWLLMERNLRQQEVASIVVFKTKHMST